ncbi:SURF1 family protein [Marinobacter sp.]|uniref:SURF1 family protein n=1 Tax=Marinobacter sp. TaxID=50741 RepID=UPI0034A2CBF8
MSESGPYKHRRWHFDWRLLVFAGAFLPVLISLGVWQLGRAEEKQQQLQQWQLQGENLSWEQQVRQGLDHGRPVTVQGRYSEYTWLLDNRTRDGAPGYEVLTLFYPNAGRPVVINRGWVRAPKTRASLPAIDAPAGEVAIQGRLAAFPEPPVLADSPRQVEGWPRRVQTLPRSAAMAQADNLASALIRLADRDQPGAYRADWAPDVMGPQTHYGYAFQWFSLALALVILTAVASYRKTGANNDNDIG